MIYLIAKKNLITKEMTIHKRFNDEKAAKDYFDKLKPDLEHRSYHLMEYDDTNSTRRILDSFSIDTGRN